MSPLLVAIVVGGALMAVVSLSRKGSADARRRGTDSGGTSSYVGDSGSGGDGDCGSDGGGGDCGGGDGGGGGD